MNSQGGGDGGDSTALRFGPGTGGTSTLALFRPSPGNTVLLVGLQKPSMWPVARSP